MAKIVRIHPDYFIFYHHYQETFGENRRISHFFTDLSNTGPPHLTSARVNDAYRPTLRKPTFAAASTVAGISPATALPDTWF